MATRVAWWLNLDAELELERPGHYVRRPEMEVRMRALSRRMTLLLAADDVVLDGSRRAHELPGFTALPFSSTPSAGDALRALGFEVGHAPALALLRAVTRRAFAASLGQTLPGARYVESLEALLALLAEGAAVSGEWLIKRDFSFAARERRRVRGGQLDDSTLGFVKRSFARDQGLQVEPYVERLADYAQHGFVLADGRILFGSPLLQHCDVRGVWQSSEALSANELSASEADALARALEEAGVGLRQAGYAGPFGIDAFRYRGPDGSIAFQPRSEVNVRFSMGYPRALLERALSSAQQSTSTEL